MKICFSIPVKRSTIIVLTVVCGGAFVFGCTPPMSNGQFDAASATDRDDASSTQTPSSNGQSAVENQVADILPVTDKDWPQIRGMDGAGIAVGSKVSPWGESGLKERWSVDVGAGFSSPIVFGEHVFLAHRSNGQVPFMDADLMSIETGRRIWRQRVPCQYGNGAMDGDPGPKSTPVFSDGRIFVLGPIGNFSALSAASGEILWQKDLLELYGTNEGYFGVGSSPIVVDNKIIVNAGGRDAAVVALDVATGDEIWTAFNDRASYSSPVAVEIDDKTAVVVVTRLHVLVIDPADGRILFQQKFGKSGPTAIGAMPAMAGTKVFINGAYNVGGRCLQLKVDDATMGGEGYKPKVLWDDPDVFASQYSTPVYRDGYFYGTSGREDFRNGSYRCVDAVSGKLIWEKKGMPVGHSILVGDKILFLDHVGKLRLIAATPEGYQSLCDFEIDTAGTRTIPAVAGECLFTKTNGVDSKLTCWALNQSSAE